jgi:pseudouridine synthase
MSDPEGRPSIGDVVRAGRHQLFPVGRLDFESSGLVLLTNDGDLAQRLTHPRYGVPKVYRVKVRGRPGERALARLARGVRLDDGKTQPADVLVEAELERKTRLVMTIHEGRHRQIRRMCETVGYPVDRLSRVSIGSLKLGRLPSGQSRELKASEIEALLGLVNRPLASKTLASGGVRWTSSARRNKPRATSRRPQKRRA